jgi:acetoacetyl-CoA synthetase
MNAFMRYAEEITGQPVASYDDLYAWSISDIEEFWKSIWLHAGIIHSKNYTQILSEEIMPGAKWFEGAELNFAENLLRYRDTHTAVISCREGKPAVRISYKELYSLVARTAGYLKSIGVKEGDVVAGYISNVPEAVIAMLASVSIGALWTSASPDFGIQGVLDRFGQTKPIILFATEEYSYNGKIFNNIEKIEKLVSEIPEIKQTILISGYFNFRFEEDKKPPVKKSVYFSSLLNSSEEDIIFEQLPFDHPVYIMYSSGTTGIPKCIVHSAGGTLLQHYKELALHTDLNRHDIITYYTTCGWMMWNWMVSSLMIGSTILLYDGNPVYPDAGVLWKLVEDEKISILGTSPKYLSSIEKIGLTPKEKYNLSSLRTLLSTGSPLTEAAFRWVYNNIKDDLQLSSISGGTDIISCFMLGCPVLPVYEGEIQCRGLGMKVEAYDEKANTVYDEKGELVCTKPFPSMPVFFWNDPAGEKYYSAYFDYYPGVWRHGDYIKIDLYGGIVIYGRSDATLNPGGVRIGTAELYRIVEEMDEVTESLAAGENRNNDVIILLFIVLKNGLTLTEELTRKIKDHIRTSASPRHVPHHIYQVSDIPRTINGKKVEVAVTRLFNGETIDNIDSLENPQVLEEYYKISETRKK